MAQNLITLQDYKSYQGLLKSDQDAKITFLIGSVSNLIKAYIGLSIIDNWDTPLTERYTVDYDSDTIFTRQWPLRNVVSITEVDRSYYDSTVHLPLTSPSDYYVSNDRIYRTRSGSPYTWSRGAGSVVIEYTSGFEETPEDLKLATINLVSYYMNKEYEQSKTIMNTSITFQASKDPTFPAHVRAVLDFYKG